MNPSLEPLSDRAKALLDADRPEQAPAAGARARVWESLAAQFVVPVAPPPAAKGLSTSLGKFTVGHALLTGAAVFAAGVGAGHFATQAWMPSPVNRVAIPVASAPAAPAVLEPPPAPTAAPPGPAPARMPPAKTPTRATERVAVDRTAAAARDPHERDPGERDPIDQALKALGREDPAAAVAALDRHAADFPNGQLSEEREALRVRALVAMGQRDAAEKVAKAFDQAFPGSLLRPSVRAALEQTLP